MSWARLLKCKRRHRVIGRIIRIANPGRAPRRDRGHEAFVNPSCSQGRFEIGDVRLEGIMPDIGHGSGTYRPVPRAGSGGNAGFGNPLQSETRTHSAYPNDGPTGI